MPPYVVGISDQLSHASHPIDGMANLLTRAVNLGLSRSLSDGGDSTSDLIFQNETNPLPNFPSASLYVDVIGMVCIATVIFIVALWCFAEWAALYVRRDDLFFRLVPFITIALMFHALNRIVTQMIRFTNINGKEHIALDVTRSFVSMLIQPAVDLQLYLRMLVVNPFPLPGQKTLPLVKIGHWTLWFLVAMDVIFCFPVAVAREYLEITYYGNEDKVYGGVRVKLSSAYQGFSVCLGAIFTFIFFRRLWHLSKIPLKRLGSDREQRNAVKFFITKNLWACGGLFLLCVFYSTINAFQNVKIGSISILLQLISVLSLRFMLDVMRDLKDGAITGKNFGKFKHPIPHNNTNNKGGDPLVDTFEALANPRDIPMVALEKNRKRQPRLDRRMKPRDEGRNWDVQRIADDAEDDEWLDEEDPADAKAAKKTSSSTQSQSSPALSAMKRKKVRGSSEGDSPRMAMTPSIQVDRSETPKETQDGVSPMSYTDSRSIARVIDNSDDGNQGSQNYLSLYGYQGQSRRKKDLGVQEIGTGTSTTVSQSSMSTFERPERVESPTEGRRGFFSSRHRKNGGGSRSRGLYLRENVALTPSIVDQAAQVRTFTSTTTSMSSFNDPLEDGDDNFLSSPVSDTRGSWPINRVPPQAPGGRGFFASRRQQGQQPLIRNGHGTIRSDSQGLYMRANVPLTDSLVNAAQQVRTFNSTTTISSFGDLEEDAAMANKRSTQSSGSDRTAALASHGSQDQPVVHLSALAMAELSNPDSIRSDHTLETLN
ncbi:hypothetical protein HDU97_008762 [Phlyctochytrium planicorne]|nr:hypothetical protein HDU97_008762 [Phlyctochytrium planicorne]